MSMPRFGGLAALLTKTAEETAKRKDIADEAVNKTGVPFLLGDVETNAGVARTEAQAAQGTANAAQGTADAANTNANGRISDASGVIVDNHLSTGLKGGLDTSFRLRKILYGTGPGAAGETHTHVSVNFKVHYTDVQRQRTIDLRAALEAVPEHRAPNPQEFATLKNLILDLAHQLIDEPTMRAEERQRKINEDSEFRHFDLMSIDPLYASAWRFEFSEGFAEELTPGSRTARMAEEGRLKYGEMIVRDPVIVEKYKAWRWTLGDTTPENRVARVRRFQKALEESKVS